MAARRRKTPKPKTNPEARTPEASEGEGAQRLGRWFGVLVLVAGAVMGGAARARSRIPRTAGPGPWAPFEIVYDGENAAALAHKLAHGISRRPTSAYFTFGLWLTGGTSSIVQACTSSRPTTPRRARSSSASSGAGART